ncbi:MAG: exodeoxyribonuclease VII large subunit [Phycisphaerales bacterium]|nr:exodeoxyribonuclease VII large subunit [Phycisphaerales bacterium]
MRVMGRLPFDPARMAGPPADDPRAGALTVSDLALRIEDALKRGVPQRLRLVGEISGFTDRNHWYFDLKDENSIISCVMFASDVRRQQHRPATGQEVILTGRVAFWGKGGRTQFYASDMQPVGAGELEARFRALCAELKGLGWFDPEVKMPLPWFPARVAVVTSRTGAALQDVLDTFRRRCPGIEVVAVDVRVQGDGAAAEVAHAIHALSEARASLGIDAIIVTRGGGSMEDLWAFNERIVAEAIHRCRLPVVAAIGHETDTTIAELVADERAATPTQAAMRLIPDRAALGEQIEAAASSLRGSVTREVQAAQRREQQSVAALRSGVRLALAHARSRVEQLAVRLEQHRPAAAQARRASPLAEAERRLAAASREMVRRSDLDSIDRDLRESVARSLGRGTDRVAALERTLQAVSPLRVLARGYSVTTRTDGRAVRSPSDVASGDELQTRLADGTIRSVVEGAAGRSTAPDGRNQRRAKDSDERGIIERRSKPPKAGRRGSDPGPPDQMGLFGA